MSEAEDHPLTTLVEHEGQVLARILGALDRAEKTWFASEDADPLQVGLVTRDAGGEVLPHRHTPLRRELVGTAEVLVIQRGRCELTVYTDDGDVVATHTLGVGDVAVLLAGGHGLKMLEPTVILEVKQGPYQGPSEKEHFTP